MRSPKASRAPSALALIPMAVAAAVVVAVALLVHGGLTGTIVVERVAFTASSTTNGHAERPSSYTLTEITETSADGTDVRDFESNTFARRGFAQVIAGETVEVYDPLDNTIFVTTQPALARQMALQSSGGTRYLRSRTVRYAQRVYTPGRHSVYAQEAAAHRYRVVGRASVDGRPALKLFEATPLHGFTVPGPYESYSTVYVEPRTYDPIEAVTRVRFPGVVSSTEQRWSVYRVLRATRANQRLLSLTALHPRATIVRSVRGYLRATQSEVVMHSYRRTTG